MPGADGDITWEGSWLTAINYTANQAVNHGGSSYVATANHLSAAVNEPGVGVDWATVWDVMAAKGGQGNPGNDGTPGVVQAVVAGSNISVDNSDPANPVVTSSAAGVTDGDKGDIVVSSGGTAWAVDSNAITYAKMQDVTATARVLGRKTAGAGDPEELTLSDVLDMIGSAAQGDLLYRGASGWARLPKGGAGQYLKQNTALTAPEWVTVPAREALTANRTYYVRADGSDANNGLANNSGGAFLTIQKAIDVIATLDLAGNTVTVQVGASTYTGANTLKSIVGGEVIIVGDETTPSNVVVNVTGASCFTADAIYGMWHLRGMKLMGNIHGISCQNGARIKFQAIEFGAVTFYHIISTGGVVVATGNYSISGGCNTHISLFLNATLQCQDRTVTITGTPAWSSAFISAGAGSAAVMNGNTYSGAATGKRYIVAGNGSITTSGGGANYFPGNVAGTATADQEYT